MKNENLSNVNYYSFGDLLEALNNNLSAENINRMGVWFDLFGMEYWNGECFQLDESREIVPIYTWDEETEQGQLVGYKLK